MSFAVREAALKVFELTVGQLPSLGDSTMGRNVDDLFAGLGTMDRVATDVPLYPVVTA